jgi:hypothetical protein
MLDESWWVGSRLWRAVHRLLPCRELDQQESLLGSGRFTTDKAGFAAMRKYVSQWPEREWAVEGSLGAGRPLAQRLMEAGDRPAGPWSWRGTATTDDLRRRQSRA